MVRALRLFPSDLCTPHGWTDPRHQTPGGHLARDELFYPSAAVVELSPNREWTSASGSRRLCARKTLD